MSAIVRHGAAEGAERRRLLEKLRLDVHDFESAFDPDELSRLELLPHGLYMIWKRPASAAAEGRLRFGVTSMGLLVDGAGLTVLAQEAPPELFRGRHASEEPVEALLNLFWNTVQHFLDHLKAARLLSAEIERKLSSSLENRYLLQLFSIGEGLIHYLNALEGNAAVLIQLKSHAARLGVSPAQARALDDIIIEYEQCRRQTEIYEQSLAGLMDARGTIINNNMNVLLKKLTLINVVFLPLSLLAGIGGMSEFTALARAAGWSPATAYLILLPGMSALGGLTWLALREMGRPSTRRPRRRARRERGG